MRAGKLTVLLCILAVQSLGVFNIFAAEQSKRKLNAYLKMLG